MNYNCLPLELQWKIWEYVSLKDRFKTYKSFPTLRGSLIPTLYHSVLFHVHDIESSVPVYQKLLQINSRLCKNEKNTEAMGVNVNHKHLAETLEEVPTRAVGLLQLIFSRKNTLATITASVNIISWYLSQEYSTNTALSLAIGSEFAVTALVNQKSKKLLSKIHEMCIFEGSVYPTLNQLKGVYFFNLKHCQFTVPRYISTLNSFRSFPNLETLIINNSWHSDNNIIEDKLVNIDKLYLLKNLKSLRIVGFPKLQSIGWLINMHQLTEILLQDCPYIKEANFLSLKGLEYLALNNIPIENLNFFKIQNLKHVNFSNIKNSYSSLIKIGNILYSNTKIETMNFYKSQTFSSAYNGYVHYKLKRLRTDHCGYISIGDVSDLRTLEKLSIENNEIAIIRNLHTLRDLFELNMAKNKIRKIQNLNDLTKLKVLDLKRNFIEKIENLENLENLRYLRLSYNSIKKIENLEKLINLQILDLSGNLIEKIENLEKLSSLESLGLSYNRIREIKELKDLPFLSILTVRGCKVAKIKNLPKNLKMLDLSENRIKTIENLEKLENLEILLLEKTLIEVVKNLSNLPSLRKAYFYANRIKKIEPIINVPHLEFLKVSIIEPITISKSVRKLIDREILQTAAFDPFVIHSNIK